MVENNVMTIYKNIAPSQLGIQVFHCNSILS